MKYTKEVLEEVVPRCTSVLGVMRELGITYRSGGIHSHLTKKIKDYKLDISHFTGQAHQKNRVAKNKLKPEQILVLRLEGSRQHHYLLKRALLESGVKYQCVKCSIKSWNSRPITLEIDHIDGNFLDDRIKNLQFLCPNCHSQKTKCAHVSQLAEEAALEAVQCEFESHRGYHDFR